MPEVPRTPEMRSTPFTSTPVLGSLAPLLASPSRNAAEAPPIEGIAALGLETAAEALALVNNEPDTAPMQNDAGAPERIIPPTPAEQRPVEENGQGPMEAASGARQKDPSRRKGDSKENKVSL